MRLRGCKAARLKGCGDVMGLQGCVPVEPLVVARWAALTDAVVPPRPAALALVRVSRLTALIGAAGGRGGRALSGVYAGAYEL